MKEVVKVMLMFEGKAQPACQLPCYANVGQMMHWPDLGLNPRKAPRLTAHHPCGLDAAMPSFGEPQLSRNDGASLSEYDLFACT